MHIKTKCIFSVWFQSKFNFVQYKFRIWKFGMEVNVDFSMSVTFAYVASQIKQNPFDIQMFTFSNELKNWWKFITMCGDEGWQSIYDVLFLTTTLVDDIIVVSKLSSSVRDQNICFWLFKFEIEQSFMKNNMFFWILVFVCDSGIWIICLYILCADRYLFLLNHDL